MWTLIDAGFAKRHRGRPAMPSTPARDPFLPLGETHRSVRKPMRGAGNRNCCAQPQASMAPSVARGAADCLHRSGHPRNSCSRKDGRGIPSPMKCNFGELRSRLFWTRRCFFPPTHASVLSIAASKRRFSFIANTSNHSGDISSRPAVPFNGNRSPAAQVWWFACSYLIKFSELRLIPFTDSASDCAEPVSSAPGS